MVVPNVFFQKCKRKKGSFVLFDGGGGGSSMTKNFLKGPDRAGGVLLGGRVLM